MAQTPRSIRLRHLGLPDPELPEDWTYDVEAEDGFFWRYAVSVKCGALHYGPDGGQWYAFTVDGAHRKGRRELGRLRRKLARKIKRNEGLSNGST